MRSIAFQRVWATRGSRAVAWLLCSCLPALIQAAAPPSPIQLTDVTDQAGVGFTHTDGSSGERYIVETVASGLAIFDYDGDGDMDLYFLNGTRLPLGTGDGRSRNALWRNDGNWRYHDVTLESGLGDPGYSTGVATADYDNDGDQDVYVNNFGPSRLYRNNDDGTFTDVTAEAGVADGDEKIGAGTAFFDMENDGDLDLFVAHYVQFNAENHRSVRFNGHPAYAGPLDFRPSPFTLFRNNGDGTFTDVSEASGVGRSTGAGMGVICFDADGDGDTDVFVGNDKTGNSFFVNNGNGVFQESAGLAGLAYDASGRSQGSMGVECADWNNDERLDLYVTTYQKEFPTFFRNAGNGFFDDVTRLTQAGEGSLRYVKWGVGGADFDNDGHRDLFVACGHLHDNVDLFDNSTSYECPSLVYRNRGDGRFTNVSNQSGSGPQVRRSSRGAGFDDLDNDGDIDVVVLNSRGAPTLMRNDSRPAHWLGLRLKGTRSNRDGIGARVTLRAEGLRTVDEVRSGRGYQSDYGRRLHFGLGTRERIDRIEIRWPAGGVQILENPALDRVLEVTEE